MHHSTLSHNTLLSFANLVPLATGFSAPSAAQGQGGQFPQGFKWGVGSAAAQVESRWGRGPSNWDVFLDSGDHVADGSSNTVNTDFQNRFLDDFRLLSEAGVKSFRFSFAWPRIQPDNARAFSQAGIDTYDRLLDGMLEFGLEPFATIFHWDMPVWAGDFRNRDTAYRMADYADVLTRRFGDRIPTWALLNEPNSVAFAGYILGIHAPSLASAEAGGAAIHHQNLAAGLMAQAARANLGKNNSVTTTVNLAPMRPSSQRAPSDSVVEKADDFWNKAFLDPLFGKGYPQSVMPLVFPYIQNGDDKQITFTPDAIGVN